MPPKAKFTKEEIIEMALSIAKEQGLEAVTARELGKRLNSSARPIFTVFENMEELKALVVLRARGLYDAYVEVGLKSEMAFRGVGLAYIRFSIEQPKLFQILFMQPLAKETDVESVLPVIDRNYERILQSVEEPYGLDKESAERIYQHLWTYTHGIATMFATGVCSYTTEQIEERLTQVFTGLLIYEKGRK